MARPATAAVRLLTGEREPVRLATTGNITLSGLQTIDGVLTEVGDRILVKNQSDPRQNGIYTASAGTWYRAADARTTRTLQKGTTVNVQQGTANVNVMYAFQTVEPEIGTDNILVSPYLDVDGLLAEIDAKVAIATAKAAEAAGYAAGLNLPPIVAGDVGTSLVVKSDESGYELLKLPKFQDIWDTMPPIPISMHFGTLCGVGYIPTDPGGTVASNTTTTVANGATSIPVVNGSLFKVGQLINYIATNGEYYSTVVRSISSNTLNITKPVQGGGIASGQPIRNFYNDTTPHPNEFGYYTICDDALRQILFKSELVYRSVDSREWTAAGSGSLTTDTTPAYGNPGSSDPLMSGVNVAVTSSGDGARSRSVELEGGLYVTRIPVNGGTTTNMLIELGLTLPNGAAPSLGGLQTGVSPGAIQELEVYYRAPAGSRVWAFARATQAGAGNFWLGEITHRKITQQFAVPNYGKHILFGDSWFAQGHFYNRLVARLPKAAIINKGVFGNSAADLLARISTDVLSLSPDFVWLMCGTNDYNNGLSSVYLETMNKIIIQLAAAGIQVFLFDPSVGTSIQLDPSRKLKLGNTLEDSTGNGGSKRFTLTLAPQSVANGSSLIVGSVPFKMQRPPKIRYAGVSGNLADGIRFFWNSGVNDMSGTSVLALAGGQTYNDVTIPKTDRNNSYLTIAVVNASGGSGTNVGFTLDLEGYPSYTA